MVTLEMVQRAKVSEADFLKLYKEIFYDKGHNKIRLWLNKYNLQPTEKDEMESILAAVFVVAIDKYEYEKIKFEIYIWNKFKQTLFGYFQTKKLKKNSHLLFSDVYDYMNDNIEYNNKTIDIGYIDSDEISLIYDVDSIISLLDDLQSFIVKLKFYNSFTDKEVIEAINDKFEFEKSFNYKKEIKKIKKIFTMYFEGKL